MVEDDPGHWHKMINKGFAAAGTSVHYTHTSARQSGRVVSCCWGLRAFIFCLIANWRVTVFGEEY